MTRSNFIWDKAHILILPRGILGVPRHIHKMRGYKLLVWWLALPLSPLPKVSEERWDTAHIIALSDEAHI